MWLRKALFQVHLWTGLGVGLYVVVISLTGSVLVYRSELRQRFDPQPRTVSVAGNRLSPDALIAATRQVFPEAEIEVWTEPDNLLGGDTGRTANGVGALLLAVLSVTGLVIWWPGIDGWRRALVVDWRAKWRRVNWSVHSSFGFWTLLFIFMWAFTGIYLAFPEPFAAVVDYLEPFEEDNFDPRTGDQILYWFSYMHFGRFNEVTKVTWAAIGLVPPVMFVTGTIMWWNRVVRPWRAGR
jgi:uncharacterized iron-regulated membrane protein